MCIHAVYLLVHGIVYVLYNRLSISICTCMICAGLCWRGASQSRGSCWEFEAHLPWSSGWGGWPQHPNAWTLSWNNRYGGNYSVTQVQIMIVIKFMKVSINIRTWRVMPMHTIAWSGVVTMSLSWISEWGQGWQGCVGLQSCIECILLFIHMYM